MTQQLSDYRPLKHQRVTMVRSGKVVRVEETADWDGCMASPTCPARHLKEHLAMSLEVWGRDSKWETKGVELNDGRTWTAISVEEL